MNLILFKMFKRKITKFLTKTFVGRIADKVVLGSLVKNTVEQTSRTNGGKTDWKEVILDILFSTIPLVLLLAFLKGWITIEEMKQLIKILIP